MDDIPKANNAILTYVVGPADDGVKLRTIIRKRMNVSRRLATKLKFTEDGITVNGSRLYMDAVLKTGDEVAIKLPIETSEHIEPQPMPLDVRYEDDSLLIVNKPTGLIVHPTLGHYKDTLANGVMHYWLQKGEQFRFRPVHRLDEHTSGLVVIAKNAFVHNQLSEQLQSKTIEKIYTAIVHGKVKEVSGTLSGPIDRDPQEPHKRIVTDDGYPAVTHYTVLRSWPSATQLEIRLETGRTHQIRVHMQHFGHPLIGDPMYQLPEYAHAWQDAIGRQALHASQLAFAHPISGERIHVEAPLPDDMVRLLERLESDR